MHHPLGRATGSLLKAVDHSFATNDHQKSSSWLVPELLVPASWLQIGFEDGGIGTTRL